MNTPRCGIRWQNNNGFALAPLPFWAPNWINKRQEQFASFWATWPLRHGCQLRVGNDGKSVQHVASLLANGGKCGRWMITCMENHHVWNQAVSWCCKGIALVLPQIWDTFWGLVWNCLVILASWLITVKSGLPCNPLTSWKRRAGNTYMILPITPFAPSLDSYVPESSARICSPSYRGNYEQRQQISGKPTCRCCFDCFVPKGFTWKALSSWIYQKWFPMTPSDSDLFWYGWFKTVQRVLYAR